MFHQFQFGEFSLDAEEEYLYQGEVKINLNRRAVQVLKSLLENPGKIITKQEFFDTVWNDTFVEEANLSVAIAAIRKVLGDDPKTPKFIENLPRKGYRFIGEVRKIEKNENIPASDIQALYANAKIKSDTNSESDNAQKGFSVRHKVPFALALILTLFAIFGIGYQTYLKKDIAKSIAVLPFDNQDAETEYLSDGLAEGITDSLAKLTNLRIISRNSTFQYKNKGTDAATAGRELNVNTVLTGRIIRRGERAVVRIELTDIDNNRHLWVKEYENNAENALALQNEIARDVSGILRPVSSGNDPTVSKRGGTDNTAAHLLYLKGRYHWNKRTDIDVQKAIDYYRQSLDNDPTFALVYVGLAACYSRVKWVPEKTSQEKSLIVKDAAYKALEIDSNLGEAHAVIALNQIYFEWDMKSAEEHYQRAIELSPNYSTGHHWYAEFLAMQGRFDESFREYDVALALDPLSLAIMTDRAFNYFYAEQPDRAIKELKKIELINPNYQRTYEYLYYAYQEKDMFEEALATLDKFYSLRNISGELSNDRLAAYKSYSEKSLIAYKQSGADGYWRSRIEYETFDNDGRPPGLGMTRIYTRLGNYDRAFEYLDRSIQFKDAAVIWMKVHPEWKRLHSDPRFIDALRRVGLD